MLNDDNIHREITNLFVHTLSSEFRWCSHCVKLVLFKFFAQACTISHYGNIYLHSISLNQPIINILLNVWLYNTRKCVSNVLMYVSSPSVNDSCSVYVHCFMSCNEIIVRLFAHCFSFTALYFFYIYLWT